MIVRAVGLNGVAFEHQADWPTVGCQGYLPAPADVSFDNGNITQRSAGSQGVISEVTEHGSTTQIIGAIQPALLFGQQRFTTRAIRDEIEGVLTLGMNDRPVGEINGGDTNGAM